MLDKLLFWSGFAASARYAYKNFDVGFKKGFDYLGSAEWSRNLLLDLPAVHKTAERFIAGETVAAAIDKAKQLQEAGRLVSFEYLEEKDGTKSNSVELRTKLSTLLTRMHAADLDADITIKSSALDSGIDAEKKFELLSELLTEAWGYEKHIRLQCEESGTIYAVLELYARCREAGFTNLDISLHSNLFRTSDDLSQLIDDGAAIRIAKSTYAEPEYIAYSDSADADANFVHLMQTVLSRTARAKGVRATIATHDKVLVAETIAFANEEGIQKDEFEFEIPFGVGQDLKASLVSEGYKVRVYLPFGKEWYTYLMYRMGDDPANAAILLGNLPPPPEQLEA